MKHLSLNNSSDRYLAVSGVESHPAKLTWCQTCYLLSRQWLHLNTKCIQFPVWTLATDFVAYFHVSQIGSDELRPFTLMRIGVTSVVDPADNRTQCEEPRRDDCWKWIAAERLRWILISAYSGSVFKGGVPQGNLDGKAGLLILKKVLICSLLALRTLITSIVVLVPLRPEWMSLLRNSFLLPADEDVPTKRDLSETSGCQRTSYSMKLYLHLLHYLHSVSALLCYLPDVSCRIRFFRL